LETEDTQPANQRRRERLAWAAGAGLLLIILAASLAVFGMLAPWARTPHSAEIDAGAEGDVVAGTPTYIPPTDHPALFLVRTDAGIQALAAIPSHPRALPVVWAAAEQHFIDPALGCTFQPDGSYIRGPCPRDLDRYATSVRQGHVFIDIRQVIQGQPHT
jgi:hypothetical protein